MRTIIAIIANKNKNAIKIFAVAMRKFKNIIINKYNNNPKQLIKINNYN